MRNNRLIVWSVIAAVVAGVSLISWHNIIRSSCVNVTINYGVLKGTTEIQEACIPVSGTTKALTVLSDMGVRIEGTQKYGTAIVCRVGGLPTYGKPVHVKGHTNYVETCKDMPPEFAYWAVLIKRAQIVPNPVDVKAKWNWADTGINDIKLEAGDSIALVFADNNNVTFPN
jgi:hypothetical protein